MAKVYEALRRAEREPEPTAAPALEPLPPPREPLSPSPSPAPIPPEPPDDGLPRSRQLAGSGDKRRIALLEPVSFVAEQFRVLRTRLDSLAAERPLEVLAVTSARAGEGKSNVAINLALVIAMGVARRVLLIDCDMRRPVVHRSLGLEPEVGLAEILLGRARREDAILRVDGPGLEVLGVRMRPENPSELLAGPRMQELMAELRREYDWLILDTPSALGVPDSKIVGSLCDGTLMVVRAGETSRADVEAALEVLDRRRVVGLVLNGAEMRHERSAYLAESAPSA
jgi:capsular exopolysaccharide synthesis family protein